MGGAEKLWRLQEIRRKYFELKKRERKVLALVQGNSVEENLKKLKSEYDEIEAETKALEKEMRKREMDCQALTERERELQSELYGGRAFPKELEMIQQKIEATAKELAKAEDDVVNMVERIDFLKSSREDLVSRISDLEERLSELLANAEADLKKIRLEMGKLKELHESYIKDIDAKLLTAYNRKFKQFSLTAVAGVSKDICTGCNVHLSRNVLAQLKKGEDLVGCENCGRILYYGI